MIPHWQCECFLFQCPRIAIYFGKADDKTLSWKKKHHQKKRIKSLHKSCISRSTFPKGRRNTANNLQVEKISKTSMQWKRFTDNVKLRKKQNINQNILRLLSLSDVNHTATFENHHIECYSLKTAVILNLEYNTPML